MLLFFKRNLTEILGVVAHTANPSTLEVETELCEQKGCDDVQGCPLSAELSFLLTQRQH